jgi:hypothetical protein
LLGLLLAFIDSRPDWDDTAILVFGILISGGVLEVLCQRRPWLLALLLGVWIPLWGILVSRNYASLLALAFAFMGVYIGWFCRLMIIKARSQP